MINKKLGTFLATMSMSLLLAFPASAATYKVVPKDNLYRLGILFNTSVDTLKANNKLSGDTIYVGQTLQVPGSTYTVKKGDTLYLIAKKYGISLDSLRKANNKWDNLIYPDQTLTIPGGSASSTQPSGNNVQAPASSAQPSGSNAQASASKSVIPYSSSDLDLLARLVRAEAEDQPYSAKVSVAAVVINRVQSNEFPNTLKDVIYQRISGYYQFSPVLNGAINKPASEEDRKAALEALYGKDPTNGALFYFDTSATNKWLWSKPVAAKIDKMVFAY
ncbi:cell wall hydrolase [Clostridium sp. JNZ J1-5]|nr:LysM peptidoglycan-binding domain-containing protein [Clostridium sp.]